MVASNTSSVHEVVGDAGILTSPRHPEEFAEAIARVTGDPAVRQTLAEEGWQTAQEFTLEAVAKKVLRILKESALAKRQGSIAPR